MHQKSLKDSSSAFVTGGVISQPSSGYLSKLQVSPECLACGIIGGYDERNSKCNKPINNAPLDSFGMLHPSLKRLEPLMSFDIINSILKAEHEIQINTLCQHTLMQPSLFVVSCVNSLFTMSLQY